MPSFLKRSIDVKIIAAIAAILSVILSISSLTDLWMVSRETYKLVFIQLDGLTNTIQKSLIKDMREGKSKDVQEILEMVGTEKGMMGVRIFSEDGRILKSNNRAEIGQKVPDELLGYYKTGRRDFVSERGGIKVFNILHPIANSSQCYGCHNSAIEINGVLSVEYSLEPVKKFVFYHGVKVVAILLLTIFLLGVMVYLLLNRLVGRPLKGIQAAMAEAEKGNLDIVIPVGSEDEIGSLQKSFNHMLATIKVLNQKNLAQQRDLVKKEQELQMQEVLAEQNRALEGANREIVEKNRYYMEMLSFISHELKNPLVVLKGYLSLFMKGDLGEVRPAQDDALGAMERQVESIGEMIANYLDLTKIERGELKADKRRLDVIDGVLKPVMDEYAEMLDRAKMSVRVEALNPVREVYADPGLIRTAFSNVLSNAIKYGWPRSDIIIEVENKGDDVVASVFNEGHGIPYNDIERIFERFTRVENEETAGKKGSGLGLCIVREIVELHGGKVWAESKEGAWAKIVLALPAYTEG